MLCTKPDFTASEDTIINGNSDGISTDIQSSSPLCMPTEHSLEKTRTATQTSPKNNSLKAKTAFVNEWLKYIDITDNIYDLACININRTVTKISSLFEIMQITGEIVLSKNKKTEKVSASASQSLSFGSQPLMELVGNRSLMLEGSTGILLYESENIKINTNCFVASFFGRGLRLRCITGSCVEIEGFISKIEFIS